MIEESNSYLGEWQYLIVDEDQDMNEAEIILYFKSSPTEEQLEEIMEFIAFEYPPAQVEIQPLPNAFDRILSQDPIDAYAHIQSVKNRSMIPQEELGKLVTYLQSSDIPYEQPVMSNYIELSIDHNRLLTYDVPYALLLDRIKAVFRANVITKLKTNDQFIPIQLSYVDELDIDEILQSQTVRARNGARHSLGYFITQYSVSDYKTITAGRSGERLSIPIFRYNESSVHKLQKLIQEDNDYTMQLSGTYFENQKIIRELLTIALLVLALLFLILAAQFESLLQPFIIALTLPIGILGALLALYICGESLNIMSIVGIIILSGIDVNDAILKVDMFNRGRREGMTIHEAILEGSSRRLRAIIMTSLTTALAMLPILFATGLGSEIQRPLAIALIGGLIFGTIASIILIPAFYSFIYAPRGFKKPT